VDNSKPSKSERKRRSRALQTLGERLIPLSEEDLASLALDEQLQDAVRAAKKITSHGALRRQKQRIGKLMKNIDPAPIEAALSRINADDVAAKRRLKQAELWRDRLVSDDPDALDAFFAASGMTDERLRQLVRDFRQANSHKAEITARRHIFRRVHEILGRIPQ
jgi:ribosome-associated protein